MSWASAFGVKEVVHTRVPHAIETIDWKKLVVLDFETYYSSDYTLRKLSTSEYIRDERFHAQMMGIKIGTAKTKVVRHEKIPSVLASIDWSTHALLCHNTAFDGFILSHHYKVVPYRYYDTLSMARGLHKNDIGASLGEVGEYYGVGNKIQGVLGSAIGLRDLSPDLYKAMALYCANDVDLCLAIFKLMNAKMPAAEMELIHRTLTMFCDPVLRVDVKRVKAEHEREVVAKKELLLACMGEDKTAQVLLHGIDGALERARKAIAGTNSFAQLLRDAGQDPPIKISPTTNKPTFAFAKTDIEFSALLEHPDLRVRQLVEARIGIKSTTNETRAARFLEAGKNGMRLPIMLHYGGAHTLRFSAGNKMNAQNLKRGGELRKSILAPPGHMIVVGDSGQIEARIDGWIAEQLDLLDEFRASDAKTDRDPYCKFADVIYPGRTITKADEIERYIAKTGVLGLGYGLGAEKFQYTLASGSKGPAVFLELEDCHRIVQAYRRKNHRIAAFWRFCNNTIIPNMASGQTGSWKCLHWEKERIWLPSGMCLKYPGLRAHANENNPDRPDWTYMRKGTPNKIYGGSCCENIVQALARIVITEQWLQLDERVVMMTHDELAVLAKKKQADKVYEKLIKTMSTSPSWAPDLPLTSEGGYDTYYSK